MRPIRLNKLIADSGLASRRHADKMIESGEVTVNGKRVFELGIKVSPTEDLVKIKGKPLPRSQQKFYVMVNKPKGVLTTTSDPEDRPVITDLTKDIPARLYPVGRLDWDSEGLVVMTNDGSFVNKVIHPKSEVTKTYLVKVSGDTSNEKLQRLVRGVTIVGGKVRAKGIERYKRQVKGKYSWIKIIITEGKNRQIRRMFEKINCDVLKLQRVAIGQLKIGKLKKGDAAILTDKQLKKIFTSDSIHHAFADGGPKDLRKKTRKTTKKRGTKSGTKKRRTGTNSSH